MNDKTIYNLNDDDKGIMKSRNGFISRILTCFYYIDMYNPIKEKYKPINNETAINLLFIYLLKESIKIFYSEELIIEDQEGMLKEFEKRNIIEEDSGLSVRDLWEKNFKKFSKLIKYKQHDLMEDIWNYKKGEELEFKLSEYLDFITDEKNEEIKNNLFVNFVNEFKIKPKDNFNNYINNLNEKLKNGNCINFTKNGNGLDFFLFNNNTNDIFKKTKDDDWYKENKLNQKCLKLLIYFSSIYNKLSLKYEEGNKYVLEKNNEKNLKNDLNKKIFGIIQSECKDVAFCFYNNNEEQKNETNNNNDKKANYDLTYKERSKKYNLPIYTFFLGYNIECSWQSQECANIKKKIPQKKLQKEIELQDYLKKYFNTACPKKMPKKWLKKRD